MSPQWNSIKLPEAAFEFLSRSGRFHGAFDDTSSPRKLVKSVPLVLPPEPLSRSMAPSALIRQLLRGPIRKNFDQRYPALGLLLSRSFASRHDRVTRTSHKDYKLGGCWTLEESDAPAAVYID